MYCVNIKVAFYSNVYFKASTPRMLPNCLGSLEKAKLL